MARRNVVRTVKSAFGSMLESASTKVLAYYSAAQNGPRSQEMWGGKAMFGPRTELQISMPTLRRRSRIEYQDNPVAASAINTIVSSVVGSGIRPVILDEELADLWEQWQYEMDAAGIAVSFTNFLRLCMIEIAVAGEVLSIIRTRFKSDGLTVPLQIQLVPSEHLPVQDSNLPVDAVCGIEFDPIGRQRAYWLYDLNPTEARHRGKVPTLRSVPGASVLHAYYPVRGEQIRGEPWLSRALIPMYDVNSYIGLEMSRKRTTAHFGAVVLSPEDKNAVKLNQAPPDDGEDGGDAGTGSETGAREDGPWLEELDEGGIIYASNGVDVKTIAPADVGGSYEVFLKSQYRLIAIAMGVPYELLISDIASGASDRSIKIVMKFFELRVRDWQDMLTQDICRPIWNAFLDMALVSGAWRPKSPEDIAKARRTKWVSPSLPAFHTLQEVQANKLRLEMGVLSRQSLAAEDGTNWRETVREIEEEFRILREAGIPLDLSTLSLEKKFPVEPDPEPAVEEQDQAEGDQE